MVHILLRDFDKEERKKFKRREKRPRTFLVGRLCRCSILPEPQVFVPRAGSRGVRRDRSSHGAECSLGGPASPPQTLVCCWSSDRAASWGRFLGKNLQGHSQTKVVDLLSTSLS